MTRYRIIPDGALYCIWDDDLDECAADGFGTIEAAQDYMREAL